MARADAETYVDRLWGEQLGWAVLASKPCGPCGGSGRFRHAYYNWPIQREEFISAAVELAPRNDVFAGVLLRDARSAKQADSSALPGPWAWIDADPWTANHEALVDEFGLEAWAVHSGGEGRRHVYVAAGTDEDDGELAGPSELLRRSLFLHAVFGTDRPGADNKLLRVAGTLNHKRCSTSGPALVRLVR